MIVGANLFRDLFASARDIIGGNAVIGVDIDYDVLSANGSMLMVSRSGTAVVV